MFVATGEQTGDDARQHIATASSSHTGITRGVEDDMSVRQTQGSVMPFQQSIGLQTLSQIASLHQTLETVAAGTFKTVEFLRVWCHDDALGQLLEPRPMVGEDIDGISISHQRTLGAS